MGQFFLCLVAGCLLASFVTWAVVQINRYKGFTKEEAEEVERKAKQVFNKW